MELKTAFYSERKKKKFLRLEQRNDKICPLF